MKSHQIALELAGKKFGPQAEIRMSQMYDKAVARLEGTEKKSIQTQEPFSMNVFELTMEINGKPAKVIRVVDIETGRYVKLYRPTPESSNILEIGLIFSVEEITQGQSNIKAW
jgi:hypothetical protein